MNAAEMKLDLFRRIDGLSEADLIKSYNMILNVLAVSAEHRLSFEERRAIDAAIGENEKGNQLTREQIMAEARRKYSNLKIK